MEALEEGGMIRFQPWKGRASYANWRHRSPLTKLTPDDVRAIRASDEPTAVLAERYKVSCQNIRDIRSRRLWKWVE